MQGRLGLLGAALIMTAASISTAHAGDRSPKGRNIGTVTACSTNGHFTCYSAPVRAGRYDKWMRLKHGTWISCESDCRETLRKETVDFWDEQRQNGS
jgi:hypothetical protein